MVSAKTTVMMFVCLATVFACATAVSVTEVVTKKPEIHVEPCEYFVRPPDNTRQ